MAGRPELDDDDDFSEIYKAYTGPQVPSTTNVQEKAKTSKRSHASSDEEDEHDPNAVPTDFTSREAKVWEAKSKATERNWKKRKEEEMICKICGDPGHFTQGCPSTLGGRRNSQDFFERVAARDKQIRALFTDKVIERIERDVGCKIKMDEKFIIVSGKDRLILRKGVDAVHKVINDECNDRNSPGSHVGRSGSPEYSNIGRSRSPNRSHMGRSRSPEQSHVGRSRSPERSHVGRSRSDERSPIGSRFSRSESQRSNPSPRNSSQFHQRFDRQDRGVEDRIRRDLQKVSMNSPRARGKFLNSSYTLLETEVNLADGSDFTGMSSKEIVYNTRAYGNDGGRARSSLSRSPGRIPYSGNSYNAHRESLGSYRSEGWDQRRESDVHADSKLQPSLVQTLEELESDYAREAMDLARIRDQQEDEENYKHREALRDLRESHMKRVAALRGSHTKQWEEFLRLETQRHQQQAAHQQQMSATGYGGYQQSTFSDYDSSGNQHFAGSNFHMESRSQFSNPSESYPHSRSRDTFNDFQRQRLEGYGRAYNRY